MADTHPFCPACGAAQGDAGPPLEPSELRCPACTHAMAAWPLPAGLSVASYRSSDPLIHGCQHCGGAWVDRRTLNRIIEEAHAMATNRNPGAVPRKTMALEELVVYRPCPRCGERMNRRNFGRYSGVVVDECHACGTFFDAGELAGVVAFVRGGGLTLAERRNADEARRESEHRQRMSLAPLGSVDGRSSILGGSRARFELEVELVIGLLRWLGRWIRWIRRLRG